MMLLVARTPNKTTNKFKQFLIVLLFHTFFHNLSVVTAELTCLQCAGINCLRTTYQATQKCLNDFDICVSVFDGQMLLAQGCWEQIPVEIRNECKSDEEVHNLNKLNGCFKCNENLCNKMSSSPFECIQCDSESNENCLTNPQSLMPTRCGISRTPNQYCFAKREGARVTRGCTYDLQEQMTCLGRTDCMICQPTELTACNNIALENEESGSEDEHFEDKQPGVDVEQENTRLCYQCSGINCLRANYAATQKCMNNVDICTTVFEGQTVLAQGCWEQLPEEVRGKCSDDSECFKCNQNLCNNLASDTFVCLQCDSNNDENCRTNPHGLVPTRCNISRTLNEYCYVKQEGDRVIRGCSYSQEEQIACLSNDNCTICLPSVVAGCNMFEVGKEDNSDSSEGSNNETNEDAGGNNGSDNGSNSGGQFPTDGGENDGNTESSTKSPNHDNNSEENAGNSDSSTESPNHDNHSEENAGNSDSSTKSPHHDNDSEENAGNSDSSTESPHHDNGSEGDGGSGDEESENDLSAGSSIRPLIIYSLLNTVFVFFIK